MNQPINWSVDVAKYQSVNQLIDQSINQSNGLTSTVLPFSGACGQHTPNSLPGRTLQSNPPGHFDARTVSNKLHKK